MSALPQTIKRWCCEGKSCGNTELTLDTLDIRHVWTFYTYRRGNGDAYSRENESQDEMLEWLEATKDNLNPETE